MTTALTCDSVKAQSFMGNWIHAPNSREQAELWFRNDVFFNEHPLSATVTVASAGYFELFINERNVSVDVLAPYRRRGTDNVMTVSYDVNRFLRKGNNVIAVWYAPSTRRKNDMQLALCMSGLRADGSRYVVVTDKNWLCKEAVVTLNMQDGETLDGRRDRINWRGELTDVCCWAGVELCDARDYEYSDAKAESGETMRLVQVIRPERTYMRGDTVVYDFGKGFFGQLRATLRGTKKGQSITVGNLRYTCNGTIDEQVYHKFTTNYWREVYVSGDRRFNREQIEVMEGLIIAPVKSLFTSWEDAISDPF